MNRAYSLLNWKSVDDDKRILEGVATTPETDRMGDIVETDGITFKLPLPLLYQHNSRQPIGQVISAKATKDGITVKAQMAGRGVAPYIDEAWALVKAGLIRGFSIGFRTLEEAFMKDAGVRIIRSEWLELSVVTLPANASANILSVKSADSLLLAASGNGHGVVRLDKTATSPASRDQRKGIPMTIAEQITQFENKRAASEARMTAIMTKAGDTGSTLDATEQEEYDTLDTEVKSVDSHLVRLKAHEQRLIATAKHVEPRIPGAPPAPSGVITVRSALPKGTAFTRYVQAFVNAKGNLWHAAELAKSMWSDSTPEVELVLRAAVAAGTTTGTTWAAPLIPAAQAMQGEFLELLRPATIVGRIPGLRRVPFNISVGAQTGGGTYGWVGEGAAKPVSALAFTAVTLAFAKVAGIIVITKELAKFSNPSAEQIIRDDMVKGTAQFIDLQFVDPTVAATTANPASITNGVTPTAASGTTAAAFRTDMKALFASYLTVNDDPEQTVILMSATVALNLSLLINALGQPEFPDVSMKGGTILGLPVIISQSVGARIIILRANEILLADDGPVEIDMSEQASIIMDDAPQSSPQTTSLVSLWQHNYVGLRVDKFINYKKSRSTSVAYISNAAYGG